MVKKIIDQTDRIKLNSYPYLFKTLLGTMCMV